jgi:hypothetical protein
VKKSVVIQKAVYHGPIVRFQSRNGNSSMAKAFCWAYDLKTFVKTAIEL